MSVTCPHCRTGVRRSTWSDRQPRVACPNCGGWVALAARVPSAVRWSLAGVGGGTAVADAPTVVALATPPPDGPTPTPDASLAGVAAPVATEHAPHGVPGYRFEHPLGRGGMGTVYLARQLSLDRPVAIKVMARRWANDPVFVARFTREAFAAAQLCHPNVVPIYDIGEAGGLRYFSMEYVPGRTLADHLKAEGRLESEAAVGYVLQAARGLAHAHERGVIHRDVKPDNLLLDDQGRVKVADLGLVKTPGTLDAVGGGGADAAGVTGTRVALGTPAYMAPEQCRDAASVDHRADIYSLGCTLYVLVTGRPPFEGTTGVEVMTKHTYDPIVPPEAIVSRVPPALSAVILKMLAKHPDDRFQSMDDVVRALETWLGVRSAGAFNPRDGQIAQLEACVAEFRAAPSAVRKSRVVSWSLNACFLLALLMLFFGQLPLAFGLAAFVLQSAAAYFVLNGAREGTHLFRRVRATLFNLSAWDVSLLLAGVGLFCLLLGGLKLLTVWVGFGAFAIAGAGAVYLLFDRRAEAERAGGLLACRNLLRRMRLNGLSEDDLRLFVARYAGRHWEEFFEALFGYEAKIAARAALMRGPSSGPRDKFAAWREPLLGLLDRWEEARRGAAERQFLERVESAGLTAAGVSDSQAHARAATQADATLTRAREVRGGAVTDPRASNEPPHMGRLIGILTGPAVRACCGGALLLLFAAWAGQNVGRPATEPLRIPGVPGSVTAWVDGATVGWAGVLLLASLFSRGPRMGALVMLGAALCALGPALGLRAVEPLRVGHVAFALGSVVALAGYRVSARGTQPTQT